MIFLRDAESVQGLFIAYQYCLAHTTLSQLAVVSAGRLVKVMFYNELAK